MFKTEKSEGWDTFEEYPTSKNNVFIYFKIYKSFPLDAQNLEIRMKI